MAKKLKEYYDHEYLKFLSDLIIRQYDKFDKKTFFELTTSIEKLEFNQRQELVATALYKSFDLEYEDTVAVFYKILGEELKGNSGAFSEGWWLWTIGKYVEIYGEEHFQISIDFSKELTKRFTSEYCMRPLIKKYPEASLKILYDWSKNDNERNYEIGRASCRERV